MWIKLALQKTILGSRFGRRCVFPVLRFISLKKFTSSQQYWEQRYANDGNSGDGSYGRLAEYKAGYLNAFVKEKKISSVLEFGCGDGNQLAYATYPRYLGLDVSASAVRRCIRRFSGDATKSFFAYNPRAFYDGQNVFSAELGLSLDVIYHLVEDEVFELYLEHLFSSATSWVVIYSSNHDCIDTLAHVRHRKFTEFIHRAFPAWKLVDEIENKFNHELGVEQTSFANFYVYKKIHADYNAE